MTGGDVGTGIGAGAVIGGVGAGVAESGRWRALYNDWYWRCMNQPTPSPAAAPVCPALIPPSGYDGGLLIGSDQWKFACDQKYRTFDWNTWLFNGYDGCKHYCNLPG